MNEPGKSHQSTFLLYGLLLIPGIAIVVLGLNEYALGNGATVLAMGVLALMLPAVAFPIVFSLDQASRRKQDEGANASAAPDPRVVDLLEQIHDRLLLSDSAKRIAYRDKERAALMKAIEEDVQKGEFEAALSLIDEMSSKYGYREESESLRAQIHEARQEHVQAEVEKAVETIDDLIKTQDWSEAMRHATRMQRLYPDSPVAQTLERRVNDARETYKHDLERRFLEAADREDVELAMDLLKELDIYLTEHEAEPYREAARGVISKKRQNLGVQFKLAVSDREWTRAYDIGMQIIEEFPNSRMADEVRGMQELLKARAEGEAQAQAGQV